MKNRVVWPGPKALHYEAQEYVKDLFHRLSDTQNMELCNCKADPHKKLYRQGSMHLEQPFRCNTSK